MPRGKPRVSPFDQGTAERVLHDHYRRTTAEAEKLEREAALTITAARAARASAEKYAEALRALGHGNVVPGQTAIPHFTKLTEEEEKS